VDTEGLIDRLLGNTVSAPDIYSADVVALNLVVAMAIGMVIAYTYKAVHKGISYSQSYVYSIVIVTMVVALAMMVIGNDITRAFALLGTFTIIRYRTAVKDPKDTAFIFMALVLGLAVGASNYGIAITGTAVMMLAAVFLDRIDFGAANKSEHVLYLTVSGGGMESGGLEELLKEVFDKASMLNVNYDSGSDRTTYTYNVKKKKGQASDVVVERLSSNDSVEAIELLAAQNLVEF